MYSHRSHGTANSTSITIASFYKYNTTSNLQGHAEIILACYSYCHELLNEYTGCIILKAGARG